MLSAYFYDPISNSNINCKLWQVDTIEDRIKYQNQPRLM